MNLFSLTVRELLHRWKSSLSIALIVATITGSLAYFTVNNRGYQKEITRNARDIGSNVVILPADVDQFEYHSAGGYSDVTMSDKLITQLIEFKASLNHLIPMLERRAEFSCQSDAKLSNVDPDSELLQRASAVVVGISASIPMPGRPKAPMQKAIKAGQVQLGSELARRLKVKRDEKVVVQINGIDFQVARVNRASGTWQDAVALMNLEDCQELFSLQGQISRIEAIECTSEQCEATGLKSEVVLNNELARITDQAVLLRREQMAAARSGIRVVSRENLQLLQNALWVLLTLAIVILSWQNANQRKSEVGIFQALGYGQTRVAGMFVVRSICLTLVGSLAGILLAALLAYWQSKSLFLVTGKKFAVDWQALSTIGITALVLGSIASLVPAVLAANRHPADVIGSDQ